MGRKSCLCLVPLAASLALGCSAGTSSPSLIVGSEGTGGGPASGAGFGGDSTIAVVDAGLSRALSAHIESPPGVTVEFVTLSCSNECADVVAVAKGGFAPYSYAWEDGSTDPRRHLCPTSTTAYQVSVTDAGVASVEFKRAPEAVVAPLTANVIACPPDGGIPRDAGAGSSHDAGFCALGATPLEELTPDIFGKPAYFSGGASLPAGKYRVTYVDGCMKYDAYWTWTVQGAPTFQFELIGASTTTVLGVLPGTAAPIAFGVTGYANYDECTAANRALPPLDFDFAGGQLGLWQNDFKPEDNTAGAKSPTWRLSRMSCP